MFNILRATFGIRQDPILEKWWWHRLFKVLFVLSSTVVFFAGVAASFIDPDPRQENVRVIDTLSTYTQSHPELANSVPSFLTLGRVGVLTDSGGIEALNLPVTDVICSGSFDAHPKELAQFLRLQEPQSYSKMDVNGATAWLKQQRESDSFGQCFAPKSLELPSSGKIVAYKLTLGAWIASYARAVGLGAVVLLCYGLVVLNLYYRGFIYTVLGAASHGDPPGS